MLVTNKAAEAIGDFDWTIEPAYRYRFQSGRDEFGLLSLMLRQRERLAFRLNQVRVKSAFSDGKLLSPKALSTLKTALRRATRWVPYRRQLVRQLKQRLNRGRQATPQAASPEEGSAEAATHASRPAAFSKRDARTLLDTAKAAAFEEDTRKFFERIGIQAGDMVFIPTLGEPEVRGLERYLRESRSARTMTWHLLFRRNLWPGLRRTSRAELDALARGFEAISQTAAGAVFFYTDTEELTRQYHTFSGLPFETLPIPVGPGFYQHDTAAGQPLNVVYAGDARSEKGYQFLPRLVQDSWQHLVKPGLIRYRLQSNYNLPLREAAVVVARNQLGGFDPAIVQLLPDALQTQDYQHLVCGANIILIPYLAKPYQARSSGILAEALVAGIPVIAPAETWMAVQWIAPLREHAHALLESHPHLQIEASTLDWQPVPHDHRNADIYPGQRMDLRAELTLPGSQPAQIVLLLDQTGLEPGVFLRACLSDDAGNEQRLSLGGIAGVSTAISAPLSGSRVRLTLDSPYASVGSLLPHLICAIMTVSQPVPRSAVGCLFTEPRELYGCLNEIVTHYAHYRQSARQAAEVLRSWHHPDTLVSALVQASPVVNREPHHG